MKPKLPHALMLIACAAMTPGLVRAASLDSVLAPLNADTAGVQIRSAIDASPMLRKRLQALAKDERLTAIRIVADDNAPVKRDHSFSAATVGSTLVLTRGLLHALSNNRRSDVMDGSEVLPNNTVFVLSHLAHHLESGAEVAAMEARVQSRAKQGLEQAQRDGTTFDGTAIVAEAMQTGLRIEGGAMIQGWNALVDAAAFTAGNGRPMDEGARAMLLGPLLINFRYSDMISRAMDLPEGQRIQLRADGIPLDDRNIGAFVTVLSTSKMLDIE